jgi:hypothetical protein
MALHFCTYFDHRYLAYGLALYQSLVRCAGQPFTLFVLCLDDITFDFLRNLSLPDVRLIRLSDLEEAYPSLVTARENRSQTEYYFTLTPALPCYLLEQNPGIESLTYVEADLYFYSTLDPVYKELGDGSILIVPYRHAMGVTYNVGLLVFRNDETGRACLDWWRQRCIEWCYRRHENGKFGDEGYLEDWPSRFPNVVVSQHKGIGFAPWNTAKYTLSVRDGVVFVDSDPLVFYHFGAVRMTRSFLLRHNLPRYSTRMTPSLRKLVYAPYVRALRSAAADAWIGPIPDLECQSGNTFKSRLIRELFYARLIVAGPLLIELDYGPLGPMLVKLRRLILGLFAKPVGLSS